MQAGHVLQVMRAVVELMEAQGILLPDGSFDKAKLDTISEDVKFVQDVVAVLKSHGLEVPPNVDKIIELLALVAGFYGR